MSENLKINQKNLTEATYKQIMKNTTEKESILSIIVEQYEYEDIKNKNMIEKLQQDIEIICHKNQHEISLSDIEKIKEIFEKRIKCNSNEKCKTKKFSKIIFKNVYLNIHRTILFQLCDRKTMNLLSIEAEKNELLVLYINFCEQVHIENRKNMQKVLLFLDYMSVHSLTLENITTYIKAMNDEFLQKKSKLFELLINEINAKKIILANLPTSLVHNQNQINYESYIDFMLYHFECFCLQNENIIKNYIEFIHNEKCQDIVNQIFDFFFNFEQMLRLYNGYTFMISYIVENRRLIFQMHRYSNPDDYEQVMLHLLLKLYQVVINNFVSCTDFVSNYKNIRCLREYTTEEKLTKIEKLYETISTMNSIFNSLITSFIKTV